MSTVLNSYISDFILIYYIVFYDFQLKHLKKFGFKSIIYIIVKKFNSPTKQTKHNLPYKIDI